MTRSRSRLVLATLLLVALILLAWTLYEARRQQRIVQEALVSEASLLARSIGAGLVAASHAARELDEIVLWKLLDNARLLAEIETVVRTDAARVAEIVETNGLDSAVFYDRDGMVEASFGAEAPESFPDPLEPTISGRVDEQILGSALDEGNEQLAVAVARRGGGAVLVAIEASAARTFVQRLGVDNLLEDLVDSSGVLYLGFRDETAGVDTEVTWDGAEMPPADPSGRAFRTIRGRPTFEVEVPLRGPAGSRPSLRVGLDGAPLQEAAAAARRRTLVVGLVLLSLAIAGTAFAVVSRLRSREREEAARRLALSEAARRRSERLAAAGALTAGLAHEVRSPLNAIGLASQRLQRRLPEGDESRTMAGQIRDEVRRLEGVLREFLELASPVAENREEIELREIALDVVRLLAEEAQSLGVVLEEPRGAAAAWAEPESIRRTLVNLIRNSIQASDPGGRVRIDLSREGREAVLAVVDEGSGIDPELEGRLFDAFVTGQASGTGLGLSLVRRVAEEHGGSIVLENREKRGAVATLRIPTNPREPSVGGPAKDSDKER